MNRNVESHFATLPSVQIERSTFDRSHGYKTSFSCGQLVPFLCEEVLPGDTFDITTSKVIRSQTMLTPVMDQLFVDTFYFFVPNRLVWDHFREFCGENTQGPWAPSVEYTLPCVSSPEGGFDVGTLADYFGWPVGVEWSASDDCSPHALPLRAYALICNEFFRDQNVSDPLLIPTGDANQQGVNTGDYITDVANGGKPFIVSKYHDYFTSSLPSPQRGEAVQIPIDVPVFSGGTFPVVTTSSTSRPVDYYPLLFAGCEPTSFDNTDMQKFTATTTLNVSSFDGAGGANGQVYANTGNPTSNTTSPVAPINLATIIPNGSGGSTSAEFSVNELRLAFAYQRFLEAMARSGGRYQEMLLGLFGVRSPDARLQRPEYLGGNRVPLNVTEVTNSAQTSTDFLGDLGAKSHTNDRNHDFVKSFTEHGFLLGLMCVRYDHSYSQGFERFWTRKKFTDFYNPKFSHLGEVPIYTAEIYADGHMSKSDVFGFQEIWADYRYKPNRVTSTMRPGVAGSLAYWNLSDYYTEAPILSDAWIRESPVNVDRVLAVSSEVADQFWADIYIKNYCTRPMPLYSVPGLIDHY